MVTSLQRQMTQTCCPGLFGRVLSQKGYSRPSLTAEGSHAGGHPLPELFQGMSGQGLGWHVHEESTLSWLTSLKVWDASGLVQLAHLGQLWLGEAGLAHLGGLAHGDIALRQGTL